MSGGMQTEVEKDREIERERVFDENGSKAFPFSPPVLIYCQVRVPARVRAETCRYSSHMIRFRICMVCFRLAGRAEWSSISKCDRPMRSVCVAIGLSETTGVILS